MDAYKFGHWITTPLCAAVRNIHYDITTYLIEEKGAFVNRLRSFDIESPVFIAAKMGEMKMVEYLFQHGAVVCETGHTCIRDTALECACLSDNLEVIKFMIEKGTVLDVRSNVLYLMINDFKRNTNRFDQTLKLLLRECVLIFYDYQ